MQEGLPQGRAEGRLWQWYQTRPCLSAHHSLHTHTGGTGLYLGMYHSEKEGNCSVLGELGDLLHCTAGCSWATAELQEPGTGTADSPDPRPWRGAGSCYTSPWHWEPLIQPCSISHCFCGGQKADLGWEKSCSINKVLWPVSSLCSLIFCRFQNSRLLVFLNNFHNLLNLNKWEPEWGHAPLWG